MLDFVNIVVNDRPYRKNMYYAEIYPSFQYGYSQDLVLKGGKMVGFWNEDEGKWEVRKGRFIQYIDNKLRIERDKIEAKLKEELGEEYEEGRIKMSYMKDVNSRVLEDFIKLEKNSEQNEDIIFNTKIFFKDDIITRDDYSTTHLDYRPEPGDTPMFDELMSVLYDPIEAEKILWFMGAALSGRMPEIQKGMFLYGAKGTGKGTVIKIFRDMFQGYVGNVDLKKLTGGGDFATSQIDTVPILIDDETDLSTIKDDTPLLKLMSHDPIEVNKKYGIPYTVSFKGLLVAASNQRFKVRNFDSGITRRFVTVEPTGVKHNSKRYKELMERIVFEYPQVAQKAIDTFNNRGIFYYENFFDDAMLEYSDPIYRFVRENYSQLKNGISWKRVSALYHDYLEDIGFETKDYRNRIKAGLFPTYMDFAEQKKVDGENRTSWFFDLKVEKIFPDQDEKGNVVEEEVEDLYQIHLKDGPSLFDKIAEYYPAQEATSSGTPRQKWDDVTTTLKDIDTSKLHYVLVPLHHIVIDFDLKGPDGNKDISLNLEAASKLPPTYTELSKSGAGVHLHYYYTGNVGELANEYDAGIEIKVFSGKASLRRQLTLSNDMPIATIGHGLPLKGEEKKMYNPTEMIKWDEQKLRRGIEKNLAKKVHVNTKPSIDLIAHMLKTAENDGVEYDLSDMYQDLLIFASKSSNSASYCLKTVQNMNLNTMGEDPSDIDFRLNNAIVPDKDIWFYDVEVYSNLFVVCARRWHDPESEIAMFNPSAEDLQDFFDKPMVGFNNRDYDNQIMYYAMLGETPAELYQRSLSLVSKDKERSYRVKKWKAKELSYADIFQYLSTKQSLKLWQLEMDVLHDEIEFPWDKPVAKKDWKRVGEYCMNDVRSTENLFDYRYSDYKAHCILSEISGLPVNSTPNQHSAQIMFGDEKDPNQYFEYTDLSEIFPGYEFNQFAKEGEKSTYKGEFVGEGGYVYSEPGVYQNVGLFDIASMHPTSAIELNYFGKYTSRLQELKDIRVLIKHKKFEEAKEMFDGRLAKYLDDPSEAKALSNALKIVINSIYGLTSAKYKNKFTQERNVDNIIAKRGALFMINLKEEVQKRGYTVAHVKTDSIKIPNYDDDIKEFIFEYGKQYGYEFEHEHTFNRLALIDNVSYAGDYYEDGKQKWELTGTPMLEPFTAKTLFTKDEVADIEFMQKKSVKDAVIYLGNQRIGRFAGVYPSLTGESMWRVVDGDEDKKSYVTGTKDYKWRLWSDYQGHKDIDMDYFIRKRQAVIDAIAKVGDPDLILK